MLRKPLVIAICALLSSSFSLADHIEELVIVGSHNTRTIDVNSALIISPDTSQLLRAAPGANINGNGPLTGIPQYRGMVGPRIATSLDGHQLSPAGPNWMDPPLSYAAAGQLESLQLYRGIAPVSIAQESIGGAIRVVSNKGDFTETDKFEFDGRLIGSAQSVNSGTQLNAAVVASNRHSRIKVAAMTEQGQDAKFAGGDILPSEYERQRYALGYGFRNGPHTIQLDYTYSDTGDAGTPALPMDIASIEGDIYSLDYQFNPSEGFTLNASLFGSMLDHGMTNYHLRPVPPTALWRRNTTDSENAGFKVTVNLEDDSGQWAIGVDGYEEDHNSDIDNPNNPMFFVTAFNNAQRQIIGAFIEREQSWGDAWRFELGARYNNVTTNAGVVDGTPAMMMPPAQMLRDTFNNADRKQTDDNLDLLAKAWFEASEHIQLYAGIAQKSRAPAYQERYLWLPLQATGGLADGFTYTGNIELDSEHSRQLELGLDFRNGALSLSPRFFYNDVKDYIQGTSGEVAPANMFVQMMNNANSSNNPAPLQFNNVDAQLYGFDMDWALQLDQQWQLSGLLNYVRGERDDIEDDLYRIAPANTSVKLTFAAGKWNVSGESVLYASQNKVSETNDEHASAGYGIFNLRGSWQATPALQLAAGVDNLFDKEYAEHLSGINRVKNSDIANGERLPSYGVNIFARAVYVF
ncbi:MAG: TonB-dependent receptor [Halioglobus sp.]